MIRVIFADVSCQSADADMLPHIWGTLSNRGRAAVICPGMNALENLSMETIISVVVVDMGADCAIAQVTYAQNMSTLPNDKGKRPLLPLPE